MGLSNTTIAQIAKKAELSTGIVSHYFGDKQGLINTCMQEMLNVLRRKTEQYRAEADSHPESQIKAIIDSNFDISQVNEKAMRVWLDFWSASMHVPDLSRLQKINDQRLYSNLKFYFLKLMNGCIPIEPSVCGHFSNKWDCVNISFQQYFVIMRNS